MRQGRIVGEFTREQATQEAIIGAAMGNERIENEELKIEK
jgi:hypothetical protein